MPLRFVVDPDLPEDIGSVALSYTFYPAQDAPTETISMEQGKLDSIM
jgi:cytochrome c oxidase assembly protein Cox11